METTLGIIGGSGLYEMDGMKNIQEKEINTPFGSPSDKYIIGELDGQNIAFLPRHGRGHSLLPSELNYRANIYGFKQLGVNQIIAVSAVGSLKEEIAPTDIAVPHQFFDRTSKRVSTFFGNGIVSHIPFANPICLELADIIYNSAVAAEVKVHRGGTYLNMEGPQFSTKAESEIYRKWGMDIIGMTNLTEAKLAREAEICYATLAMVTDYDCWHPEHESVTVEMIIEYLTKNVKTAQKILKNVLLSLNKSRVCKCHSALKNTIITSKDKIPKETAHKLEIIIGKYL